MGTCIEEGDNEDGGEEEENGTFGYNSSSGTTQSLPSTSHHNAVFLIGTNGSGRVASCGYWDHTMKVHSIDSLKLLSSSTGGHVGAITCLRQGRDPAIGAIIITGGEDGTCRVWTETAISKAAGGSQIDDDDDLAYITSLSEMGRKNKVPNEMCCVRTLWGHTSAVQCLTYEADLDLALSASKTGLLCIHVVRKGYFIRSIHYLEGRNVTNVLATRAGYLVACTADRANEASPWKYEVHLFWLNGQHLKSVRTTAHVETMVVDGTGDVLICGSKGGLLSLLVLHSLDFVCAFDLSSHGAISAVWFTEDHQYLLAGSADGTFTILTDPEMRWRLLQTHLSMTPLLGGL